MNTEKCDTFHNLSVLRQEFIDIITKEGIERIINFDGNVVDDHRDSSSMRHNEYYTKLKKCLSW